MNIQFANRLLELRKGHGYSQEELAEKLGVSRQAVSKWERAEAAPDTENLVAIAALYGVSLDELLLGSTGHTVKSGKKDSVHISFKDGIHVESEEESVHVSFKNGIHVESGAHGAGEHNEGVWVNGTRVDDAHGKKAALQSLPVPLLVAAVYLVMGFAWGLWHPGWLVFFAIPLFYSLVSAIRCKDPHHFAFPVLVAGIYLVMGFVWGLWHPGWLVFLSVPAYYWLAGLFKTPK